MKLVLKRPEKLFNKRLYIYCKEIPCLDSSWHYHPEYELLYISKSSGIRFVGDSVSPFSSGDLVLVGSNLPHLWRNDPSYYEQSSTAEVRTVVIKFKHDFIGDGTFNFPEFSVVKKMLDESKYGLFFNKSESDILGQELLDIVELPPAEQSIKLLGLLYRLALIENKEILSSTDMRQYSTEPSKRLDAVLKYISDNYAKKITLDDVAKIACMTTNSFCRFFKKMTNKSFTQFLNEIRVRNAARLLIGDVLSVNQICYIVGYNSITNFYKQFKQVMGRTPNEYRKTF